jgi:hypothetical protein
LSAKPHRAGPWTIGAFALLAVYFSGQFPPFANPNELSRLETIYAVVEQGTFAIDGAIPVLGDHEDKSVTAGRFYSNKAPGLSFAAIPVYRLLRVFWPRPRAAGDFIFVLLRLLVVTSVCVAALARFSARLGSVPGAALVVLAVSFGTPFLFYARTLFGHAWTASLLFLAWDLLRCAEEREHRQRILWTIAASGAIAMEAAISEYPLAPVVALLALRAFSGRSSRRLLLFIAGASVPLALLFIYNAICFGSPFVLSSAREAASLYAGLVHKGFFGVGLPSLGVAWRMLVSPSRGLLLFSPFWLWAPLGFAKWWRSGHERADSRFVLAAGVVYFVLMTGYANWHGGWSLGNRYLLPILFLAGLSLPHALASARSRTLFLAATVFSVCSHFILTASWPHFPPDFAWPVAAGSRWFLTRGWVAPNLLSGISIASLLIPAALTAACVLAAIRSMPETAPRAMASALAGVLLGAGLLLVSPQLAYSDRLWRAAIYGAYSGRDPARQELRSVVLSAKTPAEQRQALGAWRAYGN